MSAKVASRHASQPAYAAPIPTTAQSDVVSRRRRAFRGRLGDAADAGGSWARVASGGSWRQADAQ